MEDETKKPISNAAHSDAGGEQKKQPSVIVGALIINNNGNVLLAESKKWTGMHTILGGHVDFGENLEDAVIREVKEEAGIDVNVVDKLSFEQSIFDKKYHREDKHFVFVDFLCQFEGGDDEIELNHEFEGKYEWIEPAKALEKLNMPHGTKTLLKRYLDYKEGKEYLVGWKRCQADFENYKKRQEDSSKDMMRYATQNIIMQIIPVLDNFQASVAHIPQEQKDGPWVQGIMYIQKQLESVLTDNGVDEVSANIGDNFDPKFHEAVIDKECTTCKAGKKFQNRISKIISKGYKIGDRVIKPARVVVD